MRNHLLIFVQKIFFFLPEKHQRCSFTAPKELHVEETSEVVVEVLFVNISFCFANREFSKSARAVVRTSRPSTRVSCNLSRNAQIRVSARTTMVETAAVVFGVTEACLSLRVQPLLGGCNPT